MTKYEIDDLIKRLLDNDKSPVYYHEMGIFKFGKLFYPEMFYNDFAPLHYQISQIIFSLYHPARERRIDRQAYIEVHRESGKTSFDTFLLPNYVIYNKGHKVSVRLMNIGWEGADIRNYESIEIDMSENFIVIASETASGSEAYVNNIRSQLTERGDMAEIYGEKSPRLLYLDDDRLDEKTWRRSTFVTSDNTVVRGIGVGQQIRGRQETGTRPSLAIIDDMYSENNTKTEISRNNLKNWFFNALLNSLDSVKGKAIWLGTLLNPNTVIKTFKTKNSGWYGISRPIISQKELTIAVKYATKTGEFILPTKEESIKLQDSFRTLSWPQRHDIRYILGLYHRHLVDDNLNSFYREYMNEYLEPSAKKVTEDTFYETDIKLMNPVEPGIAGNYISFEYNGIEWQGQAIYHIGIDIASSELETSDDTVISLCGFARCYPKEVGMDYESQMMNMPQGKIFPLILHIEGGKYAVTNYKHLPGMSEATTKLCIDYELARSTWNTIKIESNGQQMQIIREITKNLREAGIRQIVWPELSSNKMSKMERILSIMLPIIQKYKVIICNKNKLIKKKVFYQLLMAGNDKDDYIDSVSIGFKNAQLPPVSDAMKSLIDSKKQQVYGNQTRYEEIENLVGTKDAWMYI